MYTIVFQFDHERVGREAGKLGVRILNHVLYGSEPGVDFTDELEKFTRRGKYLDYGSMTGTIVNAADRRGIPVEFLGQDPMIVQLGNVIYQQRISGAVTSKTSSLAARIAGNKGATNRLLEEAGLPVPPSSVITSVDDAVAAAESIGYPVVVKPVDGKNSRGAMIDLKNEGDVREAFPFARRETRSGSVILESFIPGNLYRILVVNNQVVAVAERRRAFVTGDGVHTVAELIEIANLDPRRGVAHEKPLSRIPIEEMLIAELVKQELTLGSIPEDGQVVVLQPTPSMDRGGATIDRTEDIHPDNAEIARQAAMVVGLDVAGIDFITTDISRTVREIGGGTNEVNHLPALRRHFHPIEGAYRDVGMAVIDMLFPPGQPVRIPIVAVTGTYGQTTTTRLIAHIMTTARWRVGMTCTDGISTAGTWLASGVKNGPIGARTVLRNPAVDFAVVEVAPSSILHDGLKFDSCDVAVVTNVVPQRASRTGGESLDELARTMAVVPRAVAAGGTSVLSAEDDLSAKLAETTQGEIIYFSLDEQNQLIQDHLRADERAVIARKWEGGEMVTMLKGSTATPLLPLSEIRGTMDDRGPLTFQCVLAAAAAAIAQNVDVEDIRTALRSFTLHEI